MTDKFLCPGCPLPLLGQSATPHEWVTTRWGDEWPAHYVKPRTCTGCGGVHPEDVLRMMREGWTDEVCDRRHKGYLNPPGYQAELTAWQTANAQPQPGIGGDPMKSYPQHPIKGPPIKFYIAHFTEEQRAEVNKLSRGYRL